MVSGHLSIKNDKFYIVLSYKDEDGKRKNKWISTGLDVRGNKRRAEALLQEQKVAFQPETKSVEQPHYSDMLYADFLLEWLETMKPNLEITTYANYVLSIEKRIAPYFREKKIVLSKLTAKDIQEFYTHSMKQYQLSPNTVIHYHANIRKSLQYALQLDMIPYNPADRVERPKKKTYVASFYNVSEVNHLFSIVKGTKLEIPVIMAGFYGLRRSEILGLRWDAIDFIHHSITIKNIVSTIFYNGKSQVVEANRTKNQSSYRTLPLVTDYEEFLIEIKKKQEQRRKECGRSYNRDYLDYICVDDLGNLIHPDYVTQQFSVVLKKNQLRHIRFHDLRHSCASMLLSAGVGMKEIQEWLGHSNFSTTANIYAHLDQNSKILSAQTMMSAIKKASNGLEK